MIGPFYNVLLRGNDISSRVSKFSYDDSTEADSVLTLKFQDDDAEDILEDVDLVNGAEIAFKWGKMQGDHSKEHKVWIKDIDTDYTQNGTTVTVRAYDKGVDMKKDTSDKVWENVTAKDVCKAIADQYGLGLEFQEQDGMMTYDNLPQGGVSNGEFLQDLADKEKDGNYVWYVRNNKLYFHTRSTGVKSSKTYERGTPDVVAFRPRWRETQVEGEAVEGKGAESNAVSNPSEETDDVKTGEYKVTMGYDGDITIPDDNRKAGWGVLMVGEEDEVKNMTNSAKKEQTRRILQATLVTDGEPNREPNTVVTVSNVATRYLGNWYTKSVKHDITGSVYTCTQSLDKEATKQKSEVEVSETNKNTTEGPSEENSTVFIGYDGDIETGNYTTN